MAIPSWPVTVPYASLRDDWGITPYRSHLETEMESGDVRVRRRPAARLPLMSWGQNLNSTQFSAFRTFLESTTFDGASRFTMQVSFDGQAFTSRTVQFQAGSISWAAFSPDLTHLTAKLYIFPASVVS